MHESGQWSLLLAAEDLSPLKAVFQWTDTSAF